MPEWTVAAWHELAERLHEQALFFYLAGVPLLGVLAQWLAWRLRLPSILLLLGFGLALGAWIDPDRLLEQVTGADKSIGPRLLSPVVALSVAVILFEGGLTLKLAELREAGRVVFRLITIGAMVTWSLTTVAAWWLFELDLRMAALVGAILVVTGPTVVAPLLRQIRPSRRVGSTVKWEGIVIDPVGAVLAVLVFNQAFVGHGPPEWSDLVWPIARTAVVGVGFGLLVAWLLVRLLKRYWVPDFLHGVLFLTFALAIFAASNLLQPESGLVTVTVLGIALANQKSVPIHHVAEFKEHLGVLLISCLFVVLGSRLEPRQVLALGWPGLAFLAVLVLVVRPAAVLCSTLGSRLNWRERTFLAFLAPRGIVAAAVSSVFALEMRSAGILEVDPNPLVPITFLVIVGTVAIYGLLAAPLARWLRLADPRPQGVLFAGAEPWVRQLAGLLHRDGHAVLLVDTNFANVAAARMEGLRAECTSVLSEYVREELDLGGLGRMLAMTSNDGVNALAVREFAHIFGRSNAYQLPAKDERSGVRASVGSHLRGRILFGHGLNHGELASRTQQGWRFKRTPLTAEFGMADFRRQHGENAVILLVRDSAGNLRIATADAAVTPQRGEVVYALVQTTTEGSP
ncbi:MAG: cation:proton antiporter [Pirellulaceae bacterium]|nr:cation:proton antiporter [Pirellulaceae bacterium]